MTGTQTLKIYEILHRHLKNDADAKVVGQEIETIIDNKFFDNKNQLATKDDINSIKQDIPKSQIDIEKGFNNMIIWIVSTGLAVVGLILAFLKF